MGHVTKILSPYSIHIHQLHIFSNISKDSQMYHNGAQMESDPP